MVHFFWLLMGGYGLCEVWVPEANRDKNKRGGGGVDLQFLVSYRLIGHVFVLVLELMRVENGWIRVDDASKGSEMFSWGFVGWLDVYGVERLMTQQEWDGVLSWWELI